MNGTATTTLERFAGQQADGDYCALPTEDVEILPDEHRCAGCGQWIERHQITGDWRHVEAGDGRRHHAMPHFRCEYCNCSDPALVTFTHPGYAYVTRCGRCGGVDAYPAGAGD